eukprot:1154778-Rhodomonas_salina.1
MLPTDLGHVPRDPTLHAPLSLPHTHRLPDFQPAVLTALAVRARDQTRDRLRRVLGQDAGVLECALSRRSVR